MTDQIGVSVNQIKQASSFFTVDEVASVLRVHPETIRRAVDSGSIRAIKAGRQWRIPNDEYERVLREGVQPKKEVGA